MLARLLLAGGPLCGGFHIEQPVLTFDNLLLAAARAQNPAQALSGGMCGGTQFTNVSKDFKGTLDYILFTTDSLVPAALLDMPDESLLHARCVALVSHLNNILTPLNNTKP